MLNKFIHFCTLLLTSGVVFHHSTIIGFLCGIWIYFGAETEESSFGRMLTPDLYLLIASFLIFYRLMFRRILTEDGDLDLQAMTLAFIGDFLWAVLAMFCSVPFFMTFNFSSQRYAVIKQG